MKTSINKEFYPYALIKLPVVSAKLASKANFILKPPKWLFKDKQVSVTKRNVKTFDGAEIELLIITPNGVSEPAPCLVYYHGGAFFYNAGWYHYRRAKQYALGACCKVIFVQYRLAPKHPFPTPVKDCYWALKWTFENAKQLNIDKTKIGVGGDSAGGSLTAGVCQMARDFGTDAPLFQCLIYPVIDRKMQTPSCKKYTHTPLWNTRLSVKMWQAYLQGKTPPDIAYASPIEAKRFDNLPQAYVETAEIDCLHDEGVDYANALANAGVNVELNQIQGAMHGFDVAKKAPSTIKAIATRIAFMKRCFETDN